MTKPVLAPSFCQVAWVVRDIATAETFFVETMGVSRFMCIDHLSAKDTEGTYRGKPGNWVCHLHVAYWLDDAEFDAAIAHLESSGYPQIQSFRLPGLRIAYFDTRPAIGVMTEIVGASEAGQELRRTLKAGTF